MSTYYNNWYLAHVSFKRTNQCDIHSINLFVGSINIMAWAGIMFLLSFLNIYPIIIIGFVLIRIERSNCENIMHDVIWTWKRVFGKIEGFLWIISKKAFPTRLTASMLSNCGFSEPLEFYSLYLDIFSEVLWYRVFCH